MTSSYSIAEYKKMIGASKPKRGSKRPKVKGEKVQSEGEVILATALRALKIEFEQEFQFHPTRKWRADFHLKGKKILVEVEGGIVAAQAKWLQGAPISLHFAKQRRSVQFSNTQVLRLLRRLAQVRQHLVVIPAAWRMGAIEHPFPSFANQRSATP